MFVIPVLIPAWIRRLRNLRRDLTNRYQSVCWDLDAISNTQPGVLKIRWSAYRHHHGDDKKISASVNFDPNGSDIVRAVCIVNRSRLVVLNRCSMPSAVTIHNIPVCTPAAWPEYENLIPRRRRVCSS